MTTAQLTETTWYDESAGFDPVVDDRDDGPGDGDEDEDDEELGDDEDDDYRY